MSFTTLVGALVILLPLHLEALGFGVDAISAVSAAAGIGGIVSADFVGRLSTRFGAVRLLRGGIALMTASVMGIGLVDGLVLFLIFNALFGVATSMNRVGTQMVVRNRIDAGRRGRVHANQGLTTRIGSLIVPVAIGVLWERLNPELTFLLPVVVAVLFAFAAGNLTVAPPANAAPKGEVITPLGTMLRYSAGPILFVASRTGRNLLLPLIGLELDLSPSRIGLLVGLSAAADVIIAPVSGPIMDRYGRLFTIVPSFALTSVGFVILAAASGGWLLGVAAVVLGVGNGLSAGLLLTLGTDLAPAGNEGPFLGRYGAMSDAGRLLGPFIVGFLGEWLGLNSAALALAVVTALGLALIVVFVGETRPAVH
jgi:MFS family permease